ncbi:MAG: cell division protein FtsQ/DivIB [Acidobacteriota bacterium]
MKTSPPSARQKRAPSRRFRRPERNRVLRRSRRRRLLRHGAWLGLSLAALAVILTAGLPAGLGWLRTTPWLAITEIEIHATRHADRAKLRDRAARWRGRNLFSVDLEKARTSFLSDPWIAGATIRRVLPGRLVVEIREREPVAVLILHGNLTLVDARGATIVPWTRPIGSLDLPLLTGLDAADRAARPFQVRSGLRILDALRRHDPTWLSRLSDLDLSRSDRVTARFVDEPAPVFLDRTHVTENLDHYSAVREDIHRRIARIGAIDLRWRGRVIVLPENVQKRRATQKNG